MLSESSDCLVRNSLLGTSPEQQVAIVAYSQSKPAHCHLLSLGGCEARMESADAVPGVLSSAGAG